SSHFSSYIFLFFFFVFSFGICSLFAYFFSVLQLILCILAIALTDNDLSFLKHLIELISGIVSIPFNLHCFDSTPITVEYYLEAGKPFFHIFSCAALCSFTLHYYVLLYCHKQQLHPLINIDLKDVLYIAQTSIDFVVKIDELLPDEDKILIWWNRFETPDFNKLEPINTLNIYRS